MRNVISNQISRMMNKQKQGMTLPSLSFPGASIGTGGGSSTVISNNMSQPGSHANMHPRSKSATNMMKRNRMNSALGTAPSHQNTQNTIGSPD